MGLNKILNQLTGLFHEDKHKKKQIDSIRDLLKKLRNKEDKLSIQLKKEKNQKKIKELQISIKVVRAQQKKGKKLLRQHKNNK
jgi:molybdopterin-biosynthesis enzyme MoeA-like protein